MLPRSESQLVVHSAFTSRMEESFKSLKGVDDMTSDFYEVKSDC